MTQEQNEARRGRILVVEDEAIVALDIRRTLTHCGFEVMGTAPSGEEALTRIGSEVPDLVLMDVRLQGDLDGLETARLIHETWDIPTIFLTAFLDQEMLQRAKRSAALGYLLKPFEERQLCAAVELALHHHRCEKEGRGASPETAAGSGQEEGALLEIQTLGGLSLRYGGNVILEGHQLSRQQRELCALLLSSTNGLLPQTDVQLELWPESTEVRARSSFDSLLLRLRKTLADATGGHRDWLMLHNGVLHLQRCRIDAWDFFLGVCDAEKARRRGHAEEAACGFAAALDLWHGPFLGGAFRSEAAARFADQLERSFLDASESLGRLLLAAGDAAGAVRILERAFCQEPTSDSLVRLLHQALCRTRQQPRWTELLERHRLALHNAGFSAAEIRSILAELARLPNHPPC